MKSFALLLPALLLVACSSQTAPAPADTAATPATSSTPSAAAEAAAASSAAAAGATTAPPTETGTAAAPADANAAAVAAVPGLVAGTDYAQIPGGQPFEPRNGKIEVVEVFGYVCPACARLQPLLSAWKKKLPADVRLTYVPAAFGREWIPYAHAFYAADAMGLVDRSHDALFHAIHIAQSLPGEGKVPDEQAIARFYGNYGVDPKVFADAMHSFTIDAKLARAKQFLLSSGVEGTPTLIVDGKYRVLGKSYDDMLRITDLLIAQERAAGK
ncbi:MAG TPA: thiol:disulfide interchange protein DsbA/DsbL [Luteimonas sp.]|nr:thiol:disulfide interchange protein DsbA/DsbL [Luteimonas sp.]